MIHAGDVISYLDMCLEEKVNLQRGMNFRLHGKYSIFLMSLRINAPYADRVEENGNVLVYEGHDISRNYTTNDPKKLDQPLHNPSGKLTQNGLFFEAAHLYKQGKASAENVRVYEKIRDGIWTYNGLFTLEDAWTEIIDRRKVIKFKLVLTDNKSHYERGNVDRDHRRVIPTSVKIEVWKRDKGQCVECGNRQNLHFDHIVPYSKGGTSLNAKNIQLLCVKHNLSKKDNIQ